MIRVNQVKMKPEHTMLQLKEKIVQLLHIKEDEILSFSIVRQSIDARKKPEIFYNYVIDVTIKEEQKKVKRLKSNQINLINPVTYQFPKCGGKKLPHSPVIIGSGPAGLFCGYFLAQHGYRPILLERGCDVDDRIQLVEHFWKTGILDGNTNVQFGEGGAGTFSDGKLNTLVKEKEGRNKMVLQTFVQFGAKESIIYDAKPHIGTDVLCNVVKEIRKEIIRLGGQVRFQSKMTDVIIENGQVTGIVINEKETLSCEQLVLAIGHSARDTFSMLYEKDIPMEAKSFAVGLRVEHPQTTINMSQYGIQEPRELGAAPYKLAAQTSVNRGVYSFCMCPGGYVVNASSEPGRLAVNGMSYSGRDGQNANSAIIVAVSPEDYESEHPLAGIEFQRRLEERAYQLGNGKIPVQTYGRFRDCVETGQSEKEMLADNRKQPILEQFSPSSKGEYVFADVSRIMPTDCNRAFVEGMERFGKMIEGFNGEDVLLSGVESRTSSPVRLPRDINLESVIKGIYPCGEGAGYAGGITSAAMDGIRIAEVIAKEYAPLT